MVLGIIVLPVIYICLGFGLGYLLGQKEQKRKIPR